MSSGHSLPATITSEEINGLPLRAFEGRIELVETAEQVKAAFQEIRKQGAVGFDTETRPVFVKGQSHPVSLMQIALHNKVYLVRLKHTSMTPEIIDFMQDEKILKVGVALRDDIKALQKLKRFKPAGIYELTELSKRVGIESEGLKKLAALVLGIRISKSAQTSNWDADNLNEKQISYAATDAWVCLEVYNKLLLLLPST